MKLILGKYDKLVEENKALKRKISVLENSISNMRDRKEWIQRSLEGYLASKGVELHGNRTITAIVKMIVKI